jgi:hypothetical protein
MIELRRKLKGSKNDSAEISPSTLCAFKIFTIIRSTGPAMPNEGTVTGVINRENVCRLINEK